MIYYLVRAIIRVLAAVLFRWKVYGAHHVPADGPVILACNHVSIIDPLLVGAGVKRRVYFMAKDELFHLPILHWLLPRLGAFPVRRGSSDRQAIRAALEHLEKGRLVGIFPEGTRSVDGELQRAQSGIAFLAMKSQTPVIPAAIVGSERALKKGTSFLRPVQVLILMGPPIAPPRGELTKEALAGFSAEVMLAIANLRSELLNVQRGKIGSNLAGI